MIRIKRRLIQFCFSLLIMLVAFDCCSCFCGSLVAQESTPKSSKALSNKRPSNVAEKAKDLNKTASDQRVLIVVGVGGSDEYASQFGQWAELWKSASSHTQCVLLGEINDGDTKPKIKTWIEESGKDPNASESWLVFIGHGTFDGKRAKFNLRGPDLEASELAKWLENIKHQTIIINCASSSSPFINALSGKNRTTVTATKDGYQYNFARFGSYLAQSISNPAFDLDKDGQTSLLEAFLAASESAQDFYKQENRLATEHALVDDNGDGRGTPASWFDGVRATKRPKSGVADGIKANQVFLERRGVDAKLSPEIRKQRDELETKLELLRGEKSRMDETQYFNEIEPILIRLAELYQSLDESSPTEKSQAP